MHNFVIFYKSFLLCLAGAKIGVFAIVSGGIEVRLAKVPIIIVARELVYYLGLLDLAKFYREFFWQGIIKVIYL